MTKNCLLVCISVMLLSGCYLGDRAATTRKVAVSFVAPNQPQLALNNTQVQEAARLIDSFLTSTGYLRVTTAPDDPNLIAAYNRRTDGALKPVDGPRVYFRNGKVEVIFIEFGNRSGRPTKSTMQMCASLRKELISRYGSQQVWVGKAD